MSKFRKRPIVIEAMLFNPKLCDLPFSPEPVCCYDSDLDRWYIDTLEGEMLLTPGDWVIRGVRGEFYPCKPDFFEATYERVSDAE